MKDAGTAGAKAVSANAAAARAGAAVKPSMINNLTPATIIPLVVYARELYFYTSRGGSLAKLETFSYKEMEYRYVSADIGTKQKLMHYVKQ